MGKLASRQAAAPLLAVHLNCCHETTSKLCPCCSGLQAKAREKEPVCITPLADSGGLSRRERRGGDQDDSHADTECLALFLTI